MNPVMNQYKMSSPAERARLRVVYALLGTVFFMPVNLIAMEICLALAVVFAVCSGWKYGFGPAPSIPLLVPAAGFCFTALLSLVGSPHGLMGFAFYCFTIVQYALLYMLVIFFVRGQAERHLLLTGLFVSAAVVCLYGLYQYAHMLTLGEAAWVDNSAFPLLQRRMYSTLYNPNLLSAFLLMVMGAAASMTICTGHRSHRWLYVGLFAALSLCLILTYSRGAWLSAAALVLFFGFVWDKRLWSLFLLVPPVLLFYRGGVTNRLMSIFSYSEADTSVSMRLDMWNGALEMLGDHPVLGIGWGAFKYMYPVYNEFVQQAGITIYHAHNMFFNIAAETGLAGFFFFLWFFLGCGWYGLKALQNGGLSHFDRAMAMAMSAAVISQAVCGFGDYDLFSTQISLTFWLLCAIFSNMFIDTQKNKKKSLRNNSQ